MESDSREYCKEMLPLVSRTFALGTSLLREPLFIQVAVSYLICRIADSIEDNAEVATEIRSGLLRKASKELCHDNRQELLDGIIKAFPEEKCNSSEGNLLHNTSKVMEVFDSFSKPVQKFIEDCVIEMTNGMADTVDREVDGKMHGLKDEEDLVQYCYYVAGTVGKVLTKLFSHDRDTFTEEIQEKLRKREVDFGLGLQLTNIIKGIFDDYEREVVFLPKTLLQKHDLTVKSLFENPQQQACKDLVYSLVDLTLPYMDKAVEYTLTIPEQEDDIRLFCSLPILFALRTLKLAKENPEILLRGEPLKIKRKEVKDLHVEAAKKIDDNDRLAALFKRERNF